MKKLISFLLVIMLLSSISVSAFANDATGFTTKNASLTVGDDDATFKVTDNTATQKTDLWIQVEAADQIDAVVPLLLVFKTNIDGGNANTGTNYAITNNSTADLAVTSITVNKVAQDDDNKINPMDLVKAGSTLGEDQYEVQLVVEAVTDSQGTTIASKTFDLYDIDTAENNTQSKTALNGGVFVLPSKDEKNSDDNVTTIDVQMKTGKLSFSTKHETANDRQQLDESVGVKLLSVSYVVAINTNTAIGTEIEGENISGTVYTNGVATDKNDYIYNYPNAPVQSGDEGSGT